MANHMEEFAKMLGVELGEPFKIADDTYGRYHLYHRFTESAGIEISDDGVEWEKSTSVVLKRLLMGDARIVKLPWKPREGQECYIVAIGNEFGCYKAFWENNDTYKRWYNMGLVFKTRDEATALAEKMLAVAKEVKNNG